MSTAMVTMSPDVLPKIRRAPVPSPTVQVTGLEGTELEGKGLEGIRELEGIRVGRDGIGRDQSEEKGNSAVLKHHFYGIGKQVHTA
jgi:hypothetical protein